MSFYDIIILVVLFGAMFFGYTKGLAWQIASVAAVVVSYIAAVKFRGQVAQYVSAEPPFNNIAAMLIIFVASSLFIWLAYAYVNKSIEKAELDGFNRQIGALVGAVLGVLLVMVITLFSVSLLGQSAHDSIHESKLGPYVVRGISMVQEFVPEEFQASLNPHFENFYQQIGHDLNQPSGTFNQTAFPGGSQYTTGQPFDPSSSRAYQGNWTTSEPVQQTQGGYQTTPNQTQTGYGYPAPPANQGVNYGPPQQQQLPQQQQRPSLPPIELKLDTENLFNGAGQFIKDSFSNPNGN